ncbi:MAG: cation:proton antiporter [Chloroflexi bacterium]|nr:cation:proton antiporter [Chloroflexota bacterium]MCI0769062.1 cation:proton antiporter [Chloroflexota bacterium]
MIDFVLWFWIIALVLTVSALASGIVDRSPLSFPLIFLGLGIFLGDAGLEVVSIGPGDDLLEVVAVLTLALILFLDAVKLQLDELGRSRLAPLLIIGPGSGLIIGLTAIPLALLLDFPWIVAFIGGAALASTDPAVLREIMRDHRVPRSIRQLLKVEAGTNDMVVLPVVLILIAVAGESSRDVWDWSSFLVKLLLVGPAIGLVVGGLGAWLMGKADRRFGIRREHQALYGTGLVLGAYAAATVAGSDGFLAAFVAGFAVVLFNQNLCDCFLDYGEVTAEMLMLLSFLLFGAVLSGLFGDVAFGLSVALAAMVIVVIRPATLALVLSRARMSWPARGYVAWFGPRGLNSLLLALLAVHAGIPQAELLLGTVGVVVLASIMIHGATALPITGLYARKVAEEVLEEERETAATALFTQEETEAPLVKPDRLRQMLDEPEPPVVLDVRTRSSYGHDDAQIPGSVRVLPDEIAEWASTQTGDRVYVAYCT